MQHNGMMLEQAIRNSGIPIAELARILKVNRKTIYNWFHQRHLNMRVIYKVNAIIECQIFSDFPFLGSQEVKESTVPARLEHDKTPDFWRNKYYKLLEDYNKLLEGVSFEFEQK